MQHPAYGLLVAVVFVATVICPPLVEAARPDCEAGPGDSKLAPGEVGSWTLTCLSDVGIEIVEWSADGKTLETQRFGSKKEITSTFEHAFEGARAHGYTVKATAIGTEGSGKHSIAWAVQVRGPPKNEPTDAPPECDRSGDPSSTVIGKTVSFHMACADDRALGTAEWDIEGVAGSSWTDRGNGLVGHKTVTSVYKWTFATAGSYVVRGYATDDAGQRSNVETWNVVVTEGSGGPASARMKLDVTPSSGVLGSTFSGEATLTNAGGSPLAGKSVVFVLVADGSEIAAAATDSKGRATFTGFQPQEPGTFEFAARFPGDSGHRSAETSRSIVVTPVGTSATTLDLALSREPEGPGDSVTVTAKLQNSKGGALWSKEIEFTLDNTGERLGTDSTGLSGRASIKFSRDSPGRYDVRATFAGDRKHARATEVIEVVVPEIGQAPTALVVSASAKAPEVGEFITGQAVLTASGGKPLAGMSVRFHVNGDDVGTATTDRRGRAVSREFTSTHPRLIEIAAAFEGGSGYAPSRGSVQVEFREDSRVPTTLTLRLDPAAVAQGERFNAVAHLTDENGNSIWRKKIELVLEGSGEILGTGVTNWRGDASIPVKLSDAGRYTLRASFAGDAKFGAASDVEEVSIEEAAKIPTSLKLVPVPRLPKLGEWASLRATLTDGDGKPLAGRSVRFTLGGEDFATATTDRRGRATSPEFSPSLPGTLQAAAAFDGDVTYGAASASLAIEVHDSPVEATSLDLALSHEKAVPGQRVKATATLLGADGKPLWPQEVVFILDNTGEVLGRDTTGLRGRAVTIFVPAKAGTHDIRATFAGDSNHAASTVVKSLTVEAASVPASTLVLSATPEAPVAGDEVTFVCTLRVEASGKALPGKVVRIEVEGGPTLEEKTDSKGRARFTGFRPQQAGELAISASFAGDAGTGPTSKRLILVVGEKPLPAAAIRSFHVAEPSVVVGDPLRAQVSVENVGSVPLKSTLRLRVLDADGTELATREKRATNRVGTPADLAPGKRATWDHQIAAPERAAALLLDVVSADGTVVATAGPLTVAALLKPPVGSISLAFPTTRFVPNVAQDFVVLVSNSGASPAALVVQLRGVSQQAGDMPPRQIGSLDPSIEVEVEAGKSAEARFKILPPDGMWGFSAIASVGTEKVAQAYATAERIPGAQPIAITPNVFDAAQANHFARYRIDSRSSATIAVRATPVVHYQKVDEKDDHDSWEGEIETVTLRAGASKELVFSFPNRRAEGYGPRYVEILVTSLDGGTLLSRYFEAVFEVDGGEMLVYDVRAGGWAELEDLESAAMVAVKDVEGEAVPFLVRFDGVWGRYGRIVAEAQAFTVSTSWLAHWADWVRRVAAGSFQDWFDRAPKGTELAYVMKSAFVPVVLHLESREGEAMDVPIDLLPLPEWDAVTRKLKFTDPLGEKAYRRISGIADENGLAMTLQGKQAENYVARAKAAAALAGSRLPVDAWDALHGAIRSDGTAMPRFLGLLLQGQANLYVALEAFDGFPRESGDALGVALAMAFTDYVLADVAGKIFYLASFAISVELLAAGVVVKAAKLLGVGKLARPLAGAMESVAATFLRKAVEREGNHLTDDQIRAVMKKAMSGEKGLGTLSIAFKKLRATTAIYLLERFELKVAGKLLSGHEPGFIDVLLRDHDVDLVARWVEVYHPDAVKLLHGIPFYHRGSKDPVMGRGGDWAFRIVDDDTSELLMFEIEMVNGQRIFKVPAEGISFNVYKRVWTPKNFRQMESGVAHYLVHAGDGAHHSLRAILSGAPGTYAQDLALFDLLVTAKSDSLLGSAWRILYDEWTTRGKAAGIDLLTYVHFAGRHAGRFPHGGVLVERERFVAALRIQGLDHGGKPISSDLALGDALRLFTDLATKGSSEVKALGELAIKGHGTREGADILMWTLPDGRFLFMPRMEGKPMTLYAKERSEVLGKIQGGFYRDAYGEYVWNEGTLPFAGAGDAGRVTLRRRCSSRGGGRPRPSSALNRRAFREHEHPGVPSFSPGVPA